MIKQRLASQKGVTLIELLLAVAITSIVATIAVSVFIGGVNTYKNVTVQNAVRDEADYIMARFITELYSLKRSEVVSTHFQDGSKSYFIVNKGNSGEKQIGFFGDKAMIDKEELKPQTDRFKISDESKIEELKPAYYRITLVIEVKGSDKKYELTSEFSIINDFEVTT